MVPLYVGIDVSSDDLKICMIDASAEILVNKFVVTNDDPGSSTLISKIMEVSSKYSFDKIFFGLEATGTFGSPLQYALADSLLLKPFNRTITVFNPNIIFEFRKSFGNLPKNDFKDAYVIAERVRFGKLPNECNVDFRYLALQRLTRYRYHIIQSITREKNFYLSNLFMKYSGIYQSGVFSSDFSATMSAIIDDFETVDDIATCSLDDLIIYIMDKGKKHFSDPVETAKKLIAAAKISYRLDRLLSDSIGFVLQSCLRNINLLEREVKVIDKTIAKQVEMFKNEFCVLYSVKGLGPVFIGGMIAEIGGIHRFPNQNALAKFSGLYWSEYQSGKFTAEDTNLQRSGNQYLRYYFVQAANQLRKYLPEFSEYYSRKFKESKTHHHKRALVLTARKAVRLVFVLLHESQLYIPPAKKGAD